MVCVEQTTKKYTGRKSPSYPANECCGETKKGNDGLMYVSKPNKKGICKWYKVKKPAKKSPKKQKKQSPKKQKQSPKYAQGNPENCGTMSLRLRRIKTPKVCVRVLSGPNKGKHKWVTRSAARNGMDRQSL